MTIYNPSTDTSRALADFAHKAHDFGLIIKGPPVISEDIIRVPTDEDHNGNKAGWYSLHEVETGLIYGYFGDWRTGTDGRWCNKNFHKISPLQKNKIKAYRDKINAQRDKEQMARWRAAASRAASIWDNGKDVISHPYLIKKKVQAVARVSNDPGHYNGWLMIPLTDPDGFFSTIQFINDNGEKRFLSGGKKKVVITSQLATRRQFILPRATRLPLP